MAPNKEEVNYKISKIPPGSVGLVRGQALFSRLIAWWGKHKEDLASIANHTFVYWGSGKREIVEAKFPRVCKSSLNEYLSKNYEVWMFSFQNLLVSQIQIGKAYSYGTVGREYAIKDILNFLFKRNIPEEYRDICSKNAADTMDMMKLLFVPEFMNRNLVSPSRILSWLKSKEARLIGWDETFHWNRGQIE